MSRRELKMYGAWVVVSAIIISGVRIGLELVGAHDDLTAILVVATFSLMMFLMGFLPEDPQRRKH